MLALSLALLALPSPGNYASGRPMPLAHSGLRRVLAEAQSVLRTRHTAALLTRATKNVQRLQERGGDITQARRTLRKKEDKPPAFVFDTTDADSDGAISKDEFKEMAKDIPTDELTDFWGFADADADGKLSSVEFDTVMAPVPDLDTDVVSVELGLELICDIAPDVLVRSTGTAAHSTRLDPTRLDWTSSHSTRLDLIRHDSTFIPLDSTFIPPESTRLDLHSTRLDLHSTRIDSTRPSTVVHTPTHRMTDHSIAV